MKRSPLQLDWISYPNASYEYVEGRDESSPIAVSIQANVTWDIDGQHMASILIRNEDDSASPYRLSVQVAALFKFDLDAAIEHYRPEVPLALPSMIAVNVCRIIYSGAREQIAMMTARGPIGPALIEGVIIEMSDLHISSTVDPPRILIEVFNIPEDVVGKISTRAQELKKKTRKKNQSL